MERSLVGSIAGVLLALAAGQAMATTWMEETVQDPVDGQDCSVHAPGSWGGYIYQWPGKYEQVFWPLTTERGIWSCPSGFAAFIGDIELSPAEKTAIGAWLRGQPALAPGYPAQLERLQAVYALRQLAPDRQAQVLRALAFQFENAERPEQAAALRARAEALMRGRLDAPDLPLRLRLEYLFVLANYAREAGREPDTDAALVAGLEQAPADADLRVYADYLDRLREPARAIRPGGVLDPEAGQE